MRRILWTCLVMAFVLGACGDNSNNESQETTNNNDNAVDDSEDQEQVDGEEDPTTDDSNENTPVDPPPPTEDDDTEPPPDENENENPDNDDNMLPPEIDDTPPDPEEDPVDEIVAELLDADPLSNVGWIGGSCEGISDCDYEDPLCLEESDGFAGGLCSQSCQQFCPDREEDGDTVTFCVSMEGETDGVCVARCDFDLLVNGCREGYMCAPMERHNDSSTVNSACIPEDDDFDSPASCYAELISQGVDVSSWDVPATESSGQLCWVEAPLRLESPVLGVNYRYYYDEDPSSMKVSCELAEALRKMSEMLAARDIVEVVHIGTYNCRLISGTSSLSQHSFGTAIDLAAFVRSDGHVFNLEAHWEHDTESFDTEEGAFLYDLAYDLHEAEIFNIILTPNYNAGHDNHFHVDLTPGSDFIRSVDDAPHYIGTNHGH